MNMNGEIYSWALVGATFRGPNHGIPGMDHVMDSAKYLVVPWETGDGIVSC